MIWTLAALLCAAGAYVLLSRKADDFIFHPVKTALPGGVLGARFFLPSGKGKIHVSYIPAKPGKDTILFFHGNGGNLTHFEPFAARYAARGLGVLVFDYRGFGQSAGRVSEKNAYEDGQAALDYLLRVKKIPPENVILWGFSLGNAAALQTAAQNAALPFKAVILQSPFTSSVEMGAYRFGGHYKPWSLKQNLARAFLSVLLWNKKLDNTKKIGSVRAPLLIAYSKKDETVPWRMSAALARLAPKGAKTFASPSGAHGQFGWLENRALAFLDALSRRPGADGGTSLL